MPISARLLGETELAVGCRPLPITVWPRRAARTLLLLLLTTPGGAVSRDRAIDALWPDADAAHGQNNLYKAIHALRRVLEPALRGAAASAYIVVSTERIALAPGVVGEVDLDRFLGLLAAARTGPPEGMETALWEAIACYRGDLLADEPYADWVLARREQIRLAWQGAVLDLAERTLSSDPLRIVPALEALLAGDPTSEPALLALMRAYSAGGDATRALQVYERAVVTLRDELDVAPGSALQTQADRLRGPTSRRRWRALPVPPTPLLGRDREVAAVEDLLLNDRVRLVTLTGPGGIGKTHLALEVAEKLRDEFRDGAVFVSLAPLREASLVLPTIARGLGIESSEQFDLLGQLAASLAESALLLVIDNLEQVIEAGPLLAEFLAVVPGLKFLVTSRERLWVRGEHELPVLPLPTLEPDRLPTLATVARNPAVHLFVERVRAVRPGFTLDQRNAVSVVGICRRLDGIPLAIELAAGRGRELSPVELLDRLEARLEPLDGGPRDLPDRLRTMRDAIAWSYDLLSPAEQTLFHRLSVFAGGFDPAMIGDDADAHELRTLIDKSLVLREELAGTIRCRLLEPIRDCAVGYLVESGEADRERERHAERFARLADEAFAGIECDQRAWVERLDSDQDNLRAALVWSIGACRADVAVRLAVGTQRYWRIRGRHGENRDHLIATLAFLSTPETETLRLSALLALATVASEQSDFDGAETAAADALALAERVGADGAIARAVRLLATIALHRSAFERATVLAERALAAAREVGDRFLIRDALNVLGMIAADTGRRFEARDRMRAAMEILRDDDPPDRRLRAMTQLAAALNETGEWGEAHRLLEAAVTYAHRQGYPEQEAWARAALGVHAERTGDLALAMTHYHAAVALYEDLGMLWPLAATLGKLAPVEWQQGDQGAARAAAKRALAIMHDLHDQRSLGLMVSVLGGLLRVGPDAAADVRHLAAGVAALDAIGAEPATVLPAEFTGWQTELRAEIGDETYLAAWDAGQLLSIDRAVADILA